MPQLFSRRADSRFRAILLAIAGGLLGAGIIAFLLARSDRVWGVGLPARQPIPFSHAIHAGGIGLDCRYCHAGAERGAEAGMPTAELCLGCHERVWSVDAQLAPLHSALGLGTPVEWRSVHRLPGHTRFHHAAHVANGVSCETCHGQVWTMPRTQKVRTMSMGWCLDCHRDPGPQLRPPEAMFDRDWQGGGDAGALVAQYGIRLHGLTDCSICHH